MIVVLGAGGQLGSAFVRLLGSNVQAVTRADLDLNDLGRIEPWLHEVRPQIVINCAAFTSVDDAESRADEAHRVNAQAVGELARGAAAIGARLVTFSTDYVFDGTKGRPYVESDPPNSLNVYGSTKAAGEELALEANPNALVVRTSWVMSSTHHNFIRTMVRLLHGGPVSVVDDQLGRPTFVDDLTPAVMEALEARITGILHLTNQGETTWYGLAREIADLLPFDSQVIPITTQESDRPAPRPKDSRLDSERLEREGLTPLPSYRPSLKRAVLALTNEGTWP